jgi:uncharacterized protein (TIGR03067 family)
VRTALLCLLAASTAVTAPVPKEGKKKQSDAEAIVGTWLSRYEKDDDPATEPPKVRRVYVFEAEGKLRCGYTVGGGTPGTYKLDPTTSPGTLDIEYAGGKEKDYRAAIYELKGDTLKLCIPEKSGSPRPTEFKTTDSNTLLTFKRQPAEKDGR